MCVECGKDVMSYFASSSSYSNTFLDPAFTISQKQAKSKRRLSSGKPRNIVCKCQRDTEQLTELLNSFRL